MKIGSAASIADAQFNSIVMCHAKNWPMWSRIDGKYLEEYLFMSWIEYGTFVDVSP